MSSDPQTMIDCTTPFCSLLEDPMPHLWMLSQEGLHLNLWEPLCRWVDILMQVKNRKSHALSLAGQWPVVGHLEKTHFRAVQFDSIKLASKYISKTSWRVVCISLPKGNLAFNRCLTAAICASVSSCCSVSQALDFQQRKGSCHEDFHSPSLHLPPPPSLPFCPVNKGTVQTWPPNASSLLVDALKTS